MCEAAISLPVPFHPPFTHYVPPVIHPLYEWKMQTEGGGWRGAAHGAEKVSSSNRNAHLHEPIIYEKGSVCKLPDPNPPALPLMKKEKRGLTKTRHLKAAAFNQQAVFD